MVPRTITIDEAIREAIREHAAAQVVILGAGLDARAWRMPELSEVAVFEVDHPASQRDKLRRVGDRSPIARRLAQVAVDFSQQQLGPELEAAGFARESVTVWVWEGVVPYLTPEQVRATVAQVAALSAAGSRLVVNYQARSVLSRVGRAAMRVVWRVARQPDPFAREPWLSAWAPEGMRELLRDNGFEVQSDRDLLTLSEGLDLPREGSASLGNGRIAVARRV
jgi:methyltransferase (TIGR00027 family)